ncbi:DUF4865 family protein [Sneathiella chinensis]|uniref:DUF4865 domain-containing protein n=3 Tax=Sneathiella chinensis TaxID=349750 RepID=A0ABQ5U5L2_9PROT|nr:DUF4865 domain-containing protein [Sneathiella chinensis]
MLAMQYSVRLPEDFDDARVHDRVSARGPMFEGYPGLTYKFYLYDAEEHIYAPLYIWENAQAAQSFLMNNLFGDVVQDFGRPRVRSWQILEFGYKGADVEPRFMMSEIDKVQCQKPLRDLKERESCTHQEMMKHEELVAHMVLLDPDRWEISRFSLWTSEDKAVSSKADCVCRYEVLEETKQISGAA